MRGASRPPDAGRDDYDIWRGTLAPVIGCSWTDGKPWRALPRQLDSSAEPGDQMPTWVAEAVLHQQYTVSKDSKCAFLIQPAPVRGAPYISHSTCLHIKSRKCHFVRGEPLGQDIVRCAMQGSQLPALQQSRLNAPRVLPIHKVVSYIMAKLDEQGILLGTVPIYWSKELTESEPLPENSDAPFLEVICNGMVRLHCWPICQIPCV